MNAASIITLQFDKWDDTITSRLLRNNPNNAGFQKTSHGFANLFYKFVDFIERYHTSRTDMPHGDFIIASGWLQE